MPTTSKLAALLIVKCYDRNVKVGSPIKAVVTSERLGFQVDSISAPRFHSSTRGLEWRWRRDE